ncbi:acyl-CoA/acyl-ACP dehydrogenase [Alphaproteobacteria bacterium]|jgi:acyl-CoA dehydrogenase|nr:acyl-CoA/acyl-ACP dehydrogenase [Alphaproteobacteria bacterium]|tara:strand:+ start:43 stop:1233 length:1191 start_codon:yes stop_codon:yes gene_type:complete
MIDAQAMMSLEDEDFPEIRDAVRKICEGFPGEYWRNLEDQPVEGNYPTEFVKALTDSGYLGALIPEEYGGSGMPIRAGAVILETIHETGCSAGACHAQMYTMGTVLRHGSDAQKKLYLPKIASGDLRLQAFGVTEPTTGSDTTQLKTRAVKDGDDYIVNGQKVWTSRALHSDLMLLLARTESADTVKKRSDGLSTFLIDMREAKGNGMDIKPLDAMVNHNTTEIFFDNLRIPGSSLIGEEGKGFRYILDGMNAERILISAEGVGDARFFTRRAVEYANDRVVFGRPIGQNQGVQFPIAKAYADAEAAAMMARKAAAKFDAGLPCGSEANMAKHLTAEAAWQMAEVCMATFGGFAFAREYDIERKWREVRLMRTAPISTNMILAFIGQHVLGMPRSY